MALASSDEKILAEILTLQQSTGSRCGVSKALEALSEEERSGVSAALTDPRISSPALSKFFTTRKLDVSVRTLQRHRSAECRCGRD